MNKDVVPVKGNSDLIPESVLRRTRALAEQRHPNLGRVPDGVMSLISLPEYKNSLSWKENDYGYLQLFKPDVDFEFRGMVLFINGVPATTMSFADAFTKENLSDIDMPMVTGLFNTILLNLRDVLDEINNPLFEDEMDYYHRRYHSYSNDSFWNWYMIRNKDLFGFNVPIFVPDLMRYCGYKHVYGKQLENFVEKIDALCRVVGYMDRGRDIEKRFQMMSQGFYKETYVYYLHSPYMNKLIERILRDTNHPWLNYKGKVRYDSKGQIMQKPPFVTVVDPAILSEKNKRAVEVVNKMAVWLYTIGPRNEPNKRISTLIHDCAELEDALDRAWPDTKKVNQILKRTFTAVWDYIKEYTHIYDDFDVEKIIPTKRDWKIADTKFNIHRKKKASDVISDSGDAVSDSGDASSDSSEENNDSGDANSDSSDAKVLVNPLSV